MPRRLVSVDDSFNLPASVKAGDANLPARLQDAALSATFQRKQSAVYEKAPATSQGVSVFPVTTTTGCARPTEHNTAGLFITNPAASGVTVKIGLGERNTLNAPEAFGGTYADVPPGTTWIYNGVDPVWIKTDAGSTDVIIDQEVYA